MLFEYIMLSYELYMFFPAIIIQRMGHILLKVSLIQVNKCVFTSIAPCGMLLLIHALNSTAVQIRVNDRDE